MRRFSVTNLTRRPAPRFAYANIAKAILPSWDISLAFLEPRKAKRLNEALRRKTYVPNVLSYEAGPRNGEILICLAEATRQAPSYGMKTDDFVLFLFIHGLLHLKGLPHGATMERRERMLLARFARVAPRAPSTHGTTHRNRHRHRNLPGEGRRRRGGRR